MSRVKEKWAARRVGHIRAEGGLLIIPMVVKGSDRIVELGIPQSQVERHIMTEINSLKKLSSD